MATLDRRWLGDSGLLTAADWSDGGDRLVVRTYDGGWEWQTDPAEPDAHWATAPEPIPIDVEGQGESISFHPDGGVLTTTERTPMRNVHLPCDGSVEAPTCPPSSDPDDTGMPTDTGVPTDTGPADTADTEDSAGEDSSPPGPSDSAAQDSGAAALDDSSKADGSCGCGNSSAVIWLGLLGLGLRRRSGGQPVEDL